MPEEGKLTIRDSLILMALEENPIGTYDELSKKTGYAKSVVFNTIKSLEFPRERELPYFSVSAYPNLFNLGMEIIDVIAFTHSPEQTAKLDKICLEHPYTSYRAAAFGKHNGYLIQFRVPIDDGDYIDKLFAKLIHQQIVDGYELHAFPPPYVYSTTDVHFWDIKTLNWKFSWTEFFNTAKSIPDTQLKTIKFPELRTKKYELPIKNWLNQADIGIIGQLFRNSRLRNIDMIENLKKRGYPFTPQNFSRRLKRVKETCLNEYFLFIDPSATDILNSIFIMGKADPLVLKKIHYMMETNPPPFLSKFKSLDDQMFWYIHLPPTHISSLLNHLRLLLTEMDFYYIDHPNSISFPIWDKAYDEENQQWRTGQKFMMDDVLKAISP